LKSSKNVFEKRIDLKLWTLSVNNVNNSIVKISIMKANTMKVSTEKVSTEKVSTEKVSICYILIEGFSDIETRG